MTRSATVSETRKFSYQFEMECSGFNRTPSASGVADCPCVGHVAGRDTLIDLWT